MEARSWMLNVNFSMKVLAFGRQGSDAVKVRRPQGLLKLTCIKSCKSGQWSVMPLKKVLFPALMLPSTLRVT